MWCAKCQAQFTSSREKDVPQCPRCAGPLVEEIPVPDAIQQAEKLLQRWDDDDPLESTVVPASASSPAATRQSEPSLRNRPQPASDSPLPGTPQHNFRVDSAHRDDQQQPPTAPITDSQPKPTDAPPSTPVSAPQSTSRPSETAVNADDAVSTVASTLASLPAGHHDAHQQPTGGPHGDRNGLRADSPATPMVHATDDPSPQEKNHPSMIWAQLLAYGGVLGLTAGGVLILWNRFGQPPVDAPTSWLVATAGQILLFLGVVSLISRGMEQTTEEISQQVRSLHQQLSRIEQARSNESVLPPHSDSIAARSQPAAGHAGPPSDDHEPATDATKP